MNGDKVIRFFKDFNLTEARREAPRKTPRPHQQKAIDAFNDWFAQKDFPRGGLLVLPTGAGKTFTAVHFLYTRVLPEGYKILWLAHTHHLLEQAFYSFSSDLSSIPEPKKNLRIRVVSGTPGHYEPRDIKPDDDIVIGTLQTITQAYKKAQPHFLKYLEEAKEKLFVVFDEAHHSPAPSYRKLITALRERVPSMYLLGMTATPTHTEEQKRGWFSNLFPQGIISSATVEELMAAHILAKPIFEDAPTHFTPHFDEREYRKWAYTYRDLPEDLITELAANQDRNEFIAETYVRNRARYGKTIIFADRWLQCDFLREYLRRDGIRADVIYSHIDADPGSAEARNRRDRNENSRVLGDFRNNKLDVLVNVRMLTEGTDVPNIDTVFLTRQTTSQILITQMVGRALRGPDFDGTDTAHIVSFIDDWKQMIDWGVPHLLTGPLGGGPPKAPVYTPLDLISIDLIRRLSRDMYRGGVEIPPFITLLPVGWYKIEYTVAVDGGEAQQIDRLILTFEDAEEAYANLVKGLQALHKKADLHAYEDESVELENELQQISQWRKKYFSNLEETISGDLTTHIFDVARHIAQHDGVEPQFFPFEERKNHDLDALVEKILDQDVGPKAKRRELQYEFNRDDRFWKTLYYNFDQFWEQYHICENKHLKLEEPLKREEPVKPQDQLWVQQDHESDREFTETEKGQIKQRDGRRCLCCGNTHWLQADHILSWYEGGFTELGNAQTLCSKCNGIKRDQTIDFRRNVSLLTGPLPEFPRLKDMGLGAGSDPDEWEKILRRSINFYYRCAAVSSVKIGKKGEHFYNWDIQLFEGNHPEWLEPHLDIIKQQVNAARKKAGVSSITSIRTNANLQT